MFILQILAGILISYIITPAFFQLFCYLLPKTIFYTLKGEMKIYAPFLWFVKITIQILIVYLTIAIFLFFPNFYKNSFFSSNYFVISFIFITVLIILNSVSKKKNKRALLETFNVFTMNNNFYKNYYLTAKSYCDSGNMKKDIYEDFAGAIIDYTKAIEINPNYSSLYYNRGTALLNLFDFQKAITDFDKAIILESNISVYYDGRATAKRDFGDKEGAIEDFTKSIQLNPHNSSTIINLHQLLKD